jgi:hypothetical protein
VIPEVPAIGGTKPIIAIEIGYHNAANYNGDHSPVPEGAMETSARPRFSLIEQKPECENRDWSNHFGLLRNDGTEKVPTRSAIT